MVLREQYIAEIRRFYDSDLIKIITGIQRSGKSVVLEQVMAEIRQKSDNVLYLDFEDRMKTGNITTWRELVSYAEERRKTGLYYIFLDEVQEIDGWQYACKTLRRRNASIFITGSNSKLLSGEFTKELSGRYAAFRVRLSVYRELHSDFECPRLFGKVDRGLYEIARDGLQHEHGAEVDWLFERGIYYRRGCPLFEKSEKGVGKESQTL